MNPYIVLYIQGGKKMAKKKPVKKKATKKKTKK